MSLPVLATALLLSPVAPTAPPTSSPEATASRAPELADPLADLATVPAAVAAAPAQPPRARRHARGDPYEHINRYFFARQQGFDRHFLRPVAIGYKHVVPNLLRTGLRHFFSNLGEPLVFLNYLLQLKPGKAAETAARFAVNSTLGIGGAVDVAAQPAIRLPHRPNGLGDTLGYYGVKPGPYLFLPILGPTTLRDLIGGQAEAVIIPFTVGTPFDRAEYQVTRAITTGLDARAEADQDLDALLRDAVDPYATFRSAFLQDRAGEIANLHGRRVNVTPTAELGDPLADPAGATPPALPVDRTVAPPVPTPGASAPASAPTDASAPQPGAAVPELRDPLADPAAASSSSQSSLTTPKP